MERLVTRRRTGRAVRGGRPTDILESGCRAYELVAGRLPFEGGTPSDVSR